MPQLTQMQWVKDQLSVTSRQVVNDMPPPDEVPATTFYVYDRAGQRVRKVIERQNRTRKSERMYLGGFEISREFDSKAMEVKLERDAAISRSTRKAIES